MANVHCKHLTADTPVVFCNYNKLIFEVQHQLGPRNKNRTVHYPKDISKTVNERSSEGTPQVVLVPKVVFVQHPAFFFAKYQLMGGLVGMVGSFFQNCISGCAYSINISVHRRHNLGCSHQATLNPASTLPG